MPELSRFFNIIIQMMFDDQDRHHKPHIHVRYGDYKASVALDGEMLAGNLPLKQYHLVQAWIAIHEDELYAAWNNAVRRLPVDKIEPLR